jgi:hypothetical protein
MCRQFSSGSSASVDDYPTCFDDHDHPRQAGHSPHSRVPHDLGHLFAGDCTRARSNDD